MMAQRKGIWRKCMILRFMEVGEVGEPGRRGV